MTKYRFKTEEEFKLDGLWNFPEGIPRGWTQPMLHYLGEPISNEYNDFLETEIYFGIDIWTFKKADITLNEFKEEKLEESLEKFSQLIIQIKTPLITKTMSAKVAEQKETTGLEEKFVFMNKAINLLDIGFKMKKNIVLYGPGGHGKSELTMEFFKEKGIEPYVITMGTGMTIDRLFGGLDISQLQNGGSGKIEYLVENSFMNHKYVIFEEMMDAPDFILEQLKDILSSGVFRNGSQVFNIETEFIVCCTNKSREEFAKNVSLRALMERFPFELNVIWDNYSEISYNKLLESKFGEGEVDPIIPFLLQEYHKNQITISPRIAVITYDTYTKCGPDALLFIAEFMKKPALISDTLKKYQSTIKFRELSEELETIINETKKCKFTDAQEIKDFKKNMEKFDKKISEIKVLKVNDDLVGAHTNLVKKATEIYKSLNKKEAVVSFITEEDEL